MGRVDILRNCEDIEMITAGVILNRIPIKFSANLRRIYFFLLQLKYETIMNAEM